MSDDKPFVWKPCIPKGSAATGPINEFGQHRFVVLRKISESPGQTRQELLTTLT